MRKLQVWAEISDEHFRAYEHEAERRGVTVAALVEQTVNCLLRELEEDEACAEIVAQSGERAEAKSTA